MHEAVVAGIKQLVEVAVSVRSLPPSTKQMRRDADVYIAVTAGLGKAVMETRAEPPSAEELMRALSTFAGQIIKSNVEADLREKAVDLCLAEIRHAAGLPV